MLSSGQAVVITSILLLIGMAGNALLRFVRAYRGFSCARCEYHASLCAGSEYCRLHQGPLPLWGSCTRWRLKGSNYEL